MKQKEYKDFYNTIVKRALDFFISLFFLTISFPFILISAIFIKLDSPGPVFFVQERIGYKTEKFKIYKLRTMNTKAFNEKGEKIRDRNRITKSGKIIRKLSLDELPQFYNVLKGDMSFIGPRPLLPRYLPYYTEEENRRHDVRPGITGLAQVHGRGFLQWEDRFKYDIEYVDNISFILDIKILFLTIKSVFSSEGTSTIRPKNLVDFDEHRKDREKN